MDGSFRVKMAAVCKRFVGITLSINLDLTESLCSVTQHTHDSVANGAKGEQIPLNKMGLKWLMWFVLIRSAMNHRNEVTR